MNSKPQAQLLLLAGAVTAAQVGAFAFIWSALVSYAGEHGGTPRGGVAIGITIHFGFELFVFISFLASVIAAFIRRPVVRNVALFVCLAVWLGWLYPALSRYPIRISAFAGTGALLFLLGNALVIPLGARYLRTRDTSPPNQI